MSRRGRIIALLITGLILLLFGGRWTTLLLAERWWADTISPEAGRFVSRYHLIRVFLDLGASLLASAWFVGNFFVVYRAIGSVQVSRRVANLEIHEALTPRVLVLVTVGTGILLGLLTGLGTSQWWQNVLLAWQGVTYGIVDPVLNQDFGVYVAQLPLWRRLHGLALLLTLLGLGACLLLYLLVGAIRWSGRRPAVSDHARRHLGWLSAAFVLVLAWGYWLEPYEMVAGLSGSILGEATALRNAIAHALTGIALSVALISAMWALRPRHSLMVVGWSILAVSSILGHHIIPALASALERTELDDEHVRQLEQTAFGLARLEETPPGAADSAARPPGPLSFWSEKVVGRLGEGDSSSIVAANQSTLRTRGLRLPVWITVRVMPGDSVVIAAYADDRTTLTGGPASYRPADTLAYPGTVQFLGLGPSALRPGAPDHAITTDSSGVPVNGWGRRIVLAWARQAGVLLRRLPQGGRLAWHLDPRKRLTSIAPQVAWGDPTAHIVDGELVWLADGYVTSGTFPIVERALWRDREVASIDAAFIGVVTAATGRTELFRRRPAGPLGRAWQDITGGVARPWTDLPPAILAQVTYPEELFQVEAEVMERSHWLGSRQAGRTISETGTAVASTTWSRSDTGLLQVAVFEAAGGRGIAAILVGRQWESGLRLLRTRLHGAEGFDTPAGLVRHWGRFATYEQLRDSLRSAKADTVASPVGLWIDRDGIGAYQTIFGVGKTDHRIAVAWVNVAVGDSLGAGRNLAEAWANLLGMSAPLVAGGPTGRLAEAERWMAVADSALSRGDWTLFGRAFDALREVLKPEDERGSGAGGRRGSNR